MAGFPGLKGYREETRHSSRIEIKLQLECNTHVKWNRLRRKPSWWY